MCGILGTIGFKNDARLKVDTLHHRGPDDSGVWSSEDNEHPVTLAHTRLSILDTTERSKQPMLCLNDRYIFVYNGEIYNFLELRSHLEKVGYEFFTESDSEVFLKGLVHEGPSFQLRCNGMWSFCLWDRKKRKALFGRDRFGKKPFYYTFLENDKIVFASEMKAIYPFMDSLDFSDRIDENLRYLFDYESTENCVFKNIKRLMPGHFAQYEDGKFSIKRWWNTLDHLVDVPEKYEDQVEEWRDLFLDSVKIRMRSDVRIGTALSGGLDSSAIFCAMSHISKQSITSERLAEDWQNGFCSHFPGSTLDESHWAKIVADHVGVKLQNIKIDPLDSGWSISESLYQVEDPYLTLPIPMLATYRAISSSGIKVTLDGHGADELFSGYGHLEAARKDANPKQLSELISITRSLESGVLDKSEGWGLYSWLFSRFTKALSKNLKIPAKYLLALCTGKNFEYIHYKLKFGDQNHSEFKKFDSLTKSLFEIFHVTILPTLLRNYDHYSMANGVEIRMPFMDHRLVCYTFSLPWTSKVGGGFTKRIMRDALKGILPESIRTRRDKIGWNAPLHEWLSGPLKGEIENFFKSVDVPKDLHLCWERFQNHKNPNFREGQKVWSYLMPYLWKNCQK
jgi:asparagine synthase (glutamine-hydrolysing)